MNEQQRAAIIDWLAGLTDRQFVEVFYEARACRESLVQQPVVERFAIAYLNLAEDGVWEYDMYAPPATEGDASISRRDGAFARHGYCEDCGYPIVSWSETVQCPVCGQVSRDA